eukprot:TRINITY_DN11445_c0_g1_i1.p1 TRINITY_DN11445_c0_g1~~TRINITY_DN11445_c0_g1_i1.p1  ORF type:complete len:387 (+),score=41.76 TRINITY_DN11445_c0_g1_i1:255-1415(+)
MELPRLILFRSNRKDLWLPLVLLFFWLSFAPFISESADTCNANIDDLNLAFESSNLACAGVWNRAGYILRYELKDNLLNILLSAPYTNGWVGMGFSPNGRMIGSYAVVGWIKSDQTDAIHSYHLDGKSVDAVKLDTKNDLGVVTQSLRVHYQSSTIYLSFQLQVNGTEKSKNIIFAYSSTTPTGTQLTLHSSVHSTTFDFSTGSSSTDNSIDTLRRNHGALNIFAWGVLLPIGSILARYCRQKDPAWFYLHIGFQVSGFIFGLAGVILGFELYNKLEANFPAHRGLGIFILVLGILQVSALLFRPQKEAKSRRYWNWYHHWAGRIVLFLAAVNIVIGIQGANAGKGWSVGYAFVVIILLVTVIILEVLLRMGHPKRLPQIPTFQMY